MTGELRLRPAGGAEPLRVVPERLVIAGYTAKDEASVRAHIAELAEIGVPPPATVPTFYDLDPGLLTTGPVVHVTGEKTSGEVEPVVVRHAGRYFLGVGSDHTDRDLERTGVGPAKAACPKPLGETVADLGTDLSRTAWDDLAAGCTVDGTPYQEGGIAALRHPAEIAERMIAVLGPISGDFVLYCGTLPLIGGAFVYGTHWRMRLTMPGGPSLSHGYEIERRSA